MYETIAEYLALEHTLLSLTEDAKAACVKRLIITDVYWLLRYALGRKDMEKQWLLDRCREVQAEPDGYLDLWARFHYKSTIITFGKTIQDILNNPEITIGIFSFNRPTAKKFLRQIKQEFESNELLKNLFLDILWADPRNDAVKWSEDEGIIVRRKSNPKEPTVMACGLVDSLPTGMHFKLRIYDDVVTQDSTSPDMIAKTNSAWELSLPLGMEGGKVRYIGTIYHFNDTYRLIKSRNAAKVRQYAATDDGTPDGEAILVSNEYLQQLRREMGANTFSSQMLQNPRADETQGFKRNDLRWFRNNEGNHNNKYILVDPAGEKKKGSDYTAMMVVGLGADSNYYIHDIVRDRLNLTERADHLFRLHKKWRPLRVGYEKYGMQSDIEHIQDRMSRENYNFDIVPLGGQTAKNDRIRKLIPLFEGHRIYFPETLYKTIYDGRTIDLIEQFLNEEFDAFPVSVHDDMLDCLARIIDIELGTVFPLIDEEEKRKKDAYSGYESSYRGSAWSA